MPQNRVVYGHPGVAMEVLNRNQCRKPVVRPKLVASPAGLVGNMPNAPQEIPMKQQPLPVILACEDLIIHWFNRLEKFPRAHKHGIGQQMLLALRDILNHLLYARHQTGSSRLERLIEANIVLDLFRFDLRLCVETRLITPRAQEALLDQCRNLGQQIGGWLRACQKQGPNT